MTNGGAPLGNGPYTGIPLLTRLMMEKQTVGPHVVEPHRHSIGNDQVWVYKCKYCDMMAYRGALDELRALDCREFATLGG